MPGYANTISVRRAPPTTKPRDMPNDVTEGSMALRAA